MTRDRRSIEIDELINRLEAAPAERNIRNDPALTLSAGHGSARHKAERLESIDQLMAEADRAMYLHKKQKSTLI